MKIGIVTAEVGTGTGWQLQSARLIAALQELGAEVEVVAARGTPDALDIMPPLLESRRGLLMRMYAAAPAARRALADCQIIHTLVEPFVPFGRLIAGSRPHVFTTAGTYAALPLMRRFPVGELYRRSFVRSRAVCISHYTQSVLMSAAPGAMSSVIFPGVDANWLRESAGGLEPFARNGPLVLFVGGVKHRKGALPLVRAMRQVVERHPEASCVIVGSLDAEPAYAARVRAEVERLGLAGSVILTGHIPWDDVLRWYLTGDIFVVPSMNDGWKFEGFGMVHLEAGAFGLPAIGTRECGAADAIDDGVTGLLVSQARIDDELPEAISRLLHDDQLRGAMGAANREKAQRMTWKRAAEQYLELYDAELKARR